MTTEQHNAFSRGRWRRALPQDTSNQFVVLPANSFKGVGVRVTRPVPDILSREQALNLAAWLQVIAHGEAEVAAMVEQINAWRK